MATLEQRIVRYLIDRADPDLFSDLEIYIETVFRWAARVDLKELVDFHTQIAESDPQNIRDIKRVSENSRREWLIGWIPERLTTDTDFDCPDEDLDVAGGDTGPELARSLAQQPIPAAIDTLVRSFRIWACYVYKNRSQDIKEYVVEALSWPMDGWDAEQCIKAMQYSTFMTFQEYFESWLYDYRDWLTDDDYSVPAQTVEAVGMDVVRADFDRIALLPDEGWDHNQHYHSYLLRQLPARCSFALDIGCGTGAFARQLAERAEHVLAIDLSPRMIEIARERSANHLNIEYQVADILEWELPRQHFDCIASIAAFHHLPMGELLPRVRDALSEQGVLLVLDLYKASTLMDYLVGAAAFPANVVGRLAHSGRLGVPGEVKEAWAEHGRHDRYLTLPEVRRLCAGHLPGAVVRRHLFWRYSLAWQS